LDEGLKGFTDPQPQADTAPGVRQTVAKADELLIPCWPLVTKLLF
jgi:hypothetical protein